MMDEQTKVLIAVSPEAPEWMRKIGKTLAAGGADAHGAILTVCYEDSQMLMIEHVHVADILKALGNLADTIREKFTAELAEALIRHAIREETEADA